MLLEEPGFYSHLNGLENLSMLYEINHKFEDLQKLSNYILIISNNEYPTFRGNGIINNCIIKKVIKGKDLKEKDKIRIYDLVAFWKTFGTSYLGGSTPLEIGNVYVVFLKKTTRANLSDSYVFTSVKYGHTIISKESKFLKNYLQNSMNIKEIRQYDYIFSNENTEVEIAEYLKIKADILKAVAEN